MSTNDVRRLRRDRSASGQAAVWLVLVMVVATTATVVAVRWSAATAASGRADAVADLAALAGVTGGRSGAAAVADSNGATLVAYREQGDTVVVEVRVDGLVGRAAAAPADGAAEVGDRWSEPSPAVPGG